MALTLKELEELFIKADEAGDEEDARAFLAEIDKLKAAPAVPAAPKQRSAQELQNAMMRNEPGAREEFNARMFASTGEDYKPATGATGQGFTQNATAAAGSTLGDTANGLMQYGIEGGPIGNQVRSLIGATGIQLPENPMQGWIEKRIADKRALDAPLLDAPGGTTGAITGNVLQMLTPGAATKLGSLKMPGLLNISKAFAPTSYAGNAALGAGMGAIQPRIEGESQAANAGLGGLFGIGGRALGDVARVPFNMTRNAIRNQTATGAEKRVADYLMQQGVQPGMPIAQAPLPGVRLTTAQATGNPQLAIATRGLESSNPEFAGLLSNQLRANQQAVNQTVSGLDLGSDALQASINMRRNVTSPLFNTAGKADINIASLVKKADEASKKLEGNPAAQANLQEAMQALQRTMPDGSVIPETRGWVLNNVRNALDDMIAGRGVSANKTQRVSDANIVPIKKGLDEAFANQSPEFKQAMQQYKALSGDVNQKQVLNELARPDGLLFNTRENVTLGSVANAFKNQKNIVKRTTGQKNKGLLDVLDEPSYSGLLNVRKYLSMADSAATAGRGPGPMTSQNLMTDAAKKRFVGMVPYLRDIADGLDARAKANFDDALSKALLDPSKLDEVLNTLPAKERAAGYKYLGILPNAGGVVGSAEGQRRARN